MTDQTIGRGSRADLSFDNLSALEATILPTARRWLSEPGLEDSAAGTLAYWGEIPQQQKSEPLAVYKIKAKLPIDDRLIYGFAAVELVTRGHISEDDLNPYRSGLFFEIKSTQGEDAAKRIEGKLRKDHDAARVAAGLAPFFLETTTYE